MVKETGQTFHGGHIHAKAPLRGRERWVNLLAARPAAPSSFSPFAYCTKEEVGGPKPRRTILAQTVPDLRAPPAAASRKLSSSRAGGVFLRRYPEAPAQIAWKSQQGDSRRSTRRDC